MRILDNISELYRQISQKDAEVRNLQHQIDCLDQTNLGERKEIEYLEQLVKEKKKISNSNHKEV